MDSIPFTREQVEAQVAKICATPEFLRSENKKRLLEVIIRWRLAGIDDSYAYSGDRLTADVFKKKGDTTLGKVEGRSLRIALSEYYRSRLGLNDPILIFIPSGTFRPEILPNIASSPESLYTMKLHSVATHHGSGYREPDGFPKAQHLVDEAIKNNPNHFGLIAAKALLHVMRAIYGGQPLPELEAARLLLEPRYSRYLKADLPWEAVIAHSCVRALLDWDWAFVANAIECALPSTLLSADVDRQRLFLCEGFRHYWYAGFLASQGQVSRAIEITLKYFDLLGMRLDIQHAHHVFDLARTDLAFLYICAGDWPAAETIVDAALPDQRPGMYSYPLGIMNAAILAEARGEPKEAMKYLESISGNIYTHMYSVFPPLGVEKKGFTHWLMAVALHALFAGLSGDQEAAKTGYSCLLLARGRASALPDRYFPPSTLAISALGTGDEELALQWFAQAVAERDPFILWLSTVPYLRHLRRNEDFRSLVVDTMALKLTLAEST